MKLVPGNKLNLSKQSILIWFVLVILFALMAKPVLDAGIHRNKKNKTKFIAPGFKGLKPYGQTQRMERR